jgi:hypothetical protein
MSDGGMMYWQQQGIREEYEAYLDATQQETEMPNINEMVSSKYLKQADVPDPVIVTVQGVKQVNMAKEGDAPEHKWAIKFVEMDKPMVLNATNIHVAAKVFGSDNTDEWKGKEIVLYTDPSVSFGGQVVGGLRFRGQEKAPVKAAGKPGGTFNQLADDIPF